MAFWVCLAALSKRLSGRHVTNCDSVFLQQLSSASFRQGNLALRLPAPEVSSHVQDVCRNVTQARHGGLLALKYLLAARPDAAAELLPDSLPSAMVGLQVCRLHVAVRNCC